MIRLFTDEPKVFFAISYGFIAVCYCVFIEKFCPYNGSAVPFGLLIFPYLKAFCTLRSSMAVALFLIALVVYSGKKRWLGVLLMIAILFIHRMSIAYSVFFLFDWIFEKIVDRLYGVRLGAVLFLVGLAGVMCARLLQWAILATGILDNTDSWYLRQSMGKSLFLRFPMFFAHMMVFVFLILLDKKIGRSKQWKWIRRFLAFDIVIFPATIVLGFWRANEYMYLVRLIVWSQLIPAGKPYFTAWLRNCKWLKFKKSIRMKLTEKRCNQIYRFVVTCVFLAWLMFRIYSEWDDLKIMPYILGLG